MGNFARGETGLCTASGYTVSDDDLVTAMIILAVCYGLYIFAPYLADAIWLGCLILKEI
jgi:hypothetical protein